MWHCIILKVVGSRCPQNSWSEDILNPKKKYKADSIFSKVEDLNSADFLRMSYITDIYSEFCKTFWTTISREALLLKCFVGDHYFY